eukprot:6444333-Alexandrium_andersonii.AAC.2
MSCAITATIMRIAPGEEGEEGSSGNAASATASAHSLLGFCGSPRVPAWEGPPCPARVRPQQGCPGSKLAYPPRPDGKGGGRATRAGPLGQQH